MTNTYDSYDIFLSPPDLTGRELASLAKLIESNWLAPSGPELDAFEGEFAALTGIPNALALASGTAALHLALVALGIERGDAVACPTFTFVASANPIRYVGATPIFIDCDEATWAIDPSLLDHALSARPGIRAVMAVDVYGQCCDYDVISQICTRHGVILLQDAAESLGSTYRGEIAGSQGVVAAFSFNGNKIMTTSGGGMLVSHDAAVIEHARKLSMQARESGVSHYEHSELGFNYRLSSLLAAFGRAQLADLPARVAKRREIRRRYRELLGNIEGITFMPEASYGETNAWLTCISIDTERFGADREAVRQALERERVEARPLWKPMHLQPLYAGCEIFGGRTSADLFERGLCLPSGSALTAEQQERIASIVLKSRER